jgi:nucleobase transporter 1/2
MLTTSMFLSGALGFILDNTIPGTPEERGVTAWRAQAEIHDDFDFGKMKCYDIPFISDHLRR